MSHKREVNKDGNQTINGGKTFTEKTTIKEGAGSGQSPNTGGDNLCITSDDLNTGLSILTPDGGNCNIYLGENLNSNIAGRLQYVGSVNELRAGTPGNLIRISDSVFRVDERSEVRGQVETIQFKVFSNTTSQGNPLIQLVDTAGAASWNWYNSVLRAAGRDTKFQSVAGFDVIIARSTGATGTKFDDSGDVTMFHSLGIGADPNAAAVLDVTSTTKAVLLPRMTAVQASAITPVDGMILYVTSIDATFTAIGYWVRESGVWQEVTSAGSGSASSKGHMYVSTSASTTISTADTPVKVAGTYTIENSMDFDQPVNGRLRYTGATTSCFCVNSSISMTGGNNSTYSFYIAKNGTVLTSSRVQRKLGTGADVGALPLVGSVELATNDYIEIFVENNGGTDDMTAEFMYISIK